MDFNSRQDAYEEIPYALVLDVHPPSDSETESCSLENFVLWMEVQNPALLIGIGLVSLTLISFLGAKLCCGRNEAEPEEEIHVEEETRGLFSQMVGKMMSFFGH